MANRIVINNDVITGLNILTGKAYYEHSMVGETLAADTMTFTVCLPAWDVSKYKYGDPVIFYNDYNEETQTGQIYCKQYLQKITRTGRDTWQIDTVSVIGILMTSQHYGGMYNGALASVVVADILHGVEYSIDPTIAQATVTGYLPVQSKRDNLQQVLFAIGGGVQIDADGSMLIEPLSAVSSGTFDNSRVLQGGRVEVADVVDGCTLTEHNYFESQEEVVVYDDGIADEVGERIIFDEPLHDLKLEATGTVTIVDKGVNYIIFKGIGHAKLTGKKYTHVTRVVTAGSDGSNMKSVTNAFLANPQIAQELVERVYNYLTHNTVIKQSVIMGNERPGDTVKVINPYTDEIETCCVKSMNVTLSRINKAEAEFVVGYTPEGVVSGFTNYVLFNSNGSWTVPNGVDKIRIILVGGGSGGQGGYKGEDGKGGESKSYNGTGVSIASALGGAGGKGGLPGTGGQIYELTLDVTPGQTITRKIGAGGTGGATEGGVGSIGAATTLTHNNRTYTSALGKYYNYGYYEAKSGLTFAESGTIGYDGASGGQGGTWYDASGQYHGYEDRAQSGGSLLSWSGGLGGYGYDYDDEDYIISVGSSGGGGGGGGAAYGANGGNGNSASMGYNEHEGHGGTGGKGATPATPAAPTKYGQGGAAGNGGGGGGGGGGAFSGRPYTGGSTAYQGGGGKGGAGSAGGNGGSGCVVIYY